MVLLKSQKRYANFITRGYHIYTILFLWFKFLAEYQISKDQSICIQKNESSEWITISSLYIPLLTFLNKCDLILAHNLSWTVKKELPSAQFLNLFYDFVYRFV